MFTKDIYATPKETINMSDCHFYHTVDIPGHGLVQGEWDLRDGVREYLGSVDFKGKRILEIGTASGFLCFWMESQGAKVIAYNISENQSWDLVPFAQYDYKQLKVAHREHVRRINNAFWFCHKAFKSKARMVYGTVSSVPEEIGMVDISTFGCVLLHLQNPFVALQNVLRFTRETVIITEPDPNLPHPANLGSKIPCMLLIPDFTKCEPKDT
jgi:hypothetical protein